MIHSMSGGVIKENGTYVFVKVVLDGLPQWYLSPVSEVKEGDLVLVPFGRGDLPREAEIVKREECSAQCAPVPMNRIKEIFGIAEKR